MKNSLEEKVSFFPSRDEMHEMAKKKMRGYGEYGQLEKDRLNFLYVLGEMSYLAVAGEMEMEVYVEMTPMLREFLEEKEFTIRYVESDKPHHVVSWA